MNRHTSAAWHERARTRLLRHLQRSPQPSYLIHQWRAADLRCAKAQKVLHRLIEHAPRVRAIVRRALRDTFGVDPTRLLFTEHLPAPAAPRIDTLLDRAMEVLRRGLPAAYIDAYTTLSIKDDVPRTLGFTAYQALQRIAGLKLSERLEQAHDDYWQQLAYGSALTRRQRWLQVYPGFLADKALLAHALDELSSEGLALVRQLIEAPTPGLRRQAGGEWARLEVRSVAWAGRGPARLSLSGALHLCASGNPAPRRQVLFIPGLEREFHEFASPAALDHELQDWRDGPQLPALWARLPLGRRQEVCDREGLLPLQLANRPPVAEDAVAFAATRALETQWANELTCARGMGALRVLPPPAAASSDVSTVEQARGLLTRRPRLDLHLAYLMARDARLRAQEISFTLHRRGAPLRVQEARIKQHEQGLLALLDAADLARETQGYRRVLELQAHWQVQREQAWALLEGQAARLVEPRFWLEPDGEGVTRARRLLAAQRTAWLDEGQMQQRLGLITEAELQGLTQVLSAPLDASRGGTDQRVAHVFFGRSGQPLCWLGGVFVLLNARALASPELDLPVLLCVSGIEGGMTRFASLDALSQSVTASFVSLHNTTLWRCIGRRERSALKAWVNTRAPGEEPVVYYTIHEGDVLSDSLKDQVRDHARMDQWVGQGGRPFSEVDDLGLTRDLLARELTEQVQVPPSAAREQALANVSLLRLACAQAKTLPPWFAQAASTVRRRYRRLHARYLHSAMAWEQTLWDALPDLQTYARAALVARLTRDGLYPALDIDRPLFDVPDDVSAHWQTHPIRPAGDSGSQLVVSPQRTTFSLLELALHNLDPEAPWARWRLRYMRYLEPAWQERLNPDYLIRTIAALDLGGRYEQMLQQVFYGPEGLSPRLLQRPYEQRAQWALMDAQERGLSDFAQRLLTTALSARQPEDLQKNGYRLRLCAVRLVGHTLERNRHVAGILVIVDQVTQRCVVYWPGAPAGAAVSEYADLAMARLALMTLGSAPAGLADLARRVAPGWEAEALATYPGDARPLPIVTDWPRVGFAIEPAWRNPLVVWVGWVATGMRRWFGTRRTHPALALKAQEEELREQVDAAPHDWLAIVCTRHSDPLAWLAHAQWFELLRNVRARSGSSASLNAYRQWRLGEQSDRRLRGLLAWVPGVSIGVNLYELLLASRRFHHSRDSHDALDVGFQTWITLVDIAAMLLPSAKARPVFYPALKRIGQQRREVFSVPAAPLSQRLANYRKDLSTQDAVALQGHQAHGRYVRNGEQFIVDGDDYYPIYRRPGESTPRLKSPKGDGQNELLLFIEEPRQWLLGADAPEPQPGPSSAIWRAWEPTPVTTGWQAPARPPLQRLLQQPALTSSHWHGWGSPLADNPPQPLPGPRSLYHVHGDRGYDALKLGANYYEVLPGGSNALNDVVFLKRTEPLSKNASDDLSRWLTTRPMEQPIPLTFGAGEVWTPRQPLFNRSISLSINAAFPGITQASAQFAALRLIEVADHSRFMTATRLLNIRAVLDDWLPPPPRALGQTDDLFRLLRPVVRTGNAGTHIGRDGLSPGFERVDFRLPVALPAQLRIKGAPSSERAVVVQNAVRQVLEGQGFLLTAVRKGNWAQSANFIGTHPNSSNLYYFFTRWCNDQRVSLGIDGRVALTDAWFKSKFALKDAIQRAWYEPVNQAMQQGRLVRIVAGIQVEHDQTPTVFFVKLQGD